MVVDIQQKRANRLRFLNELYERSNGRRYHNEGFLELGAALGLDPSESVDIVQYLLGEGLLENVTSGSVGLSHYGIKEVEDARLAPEEPTEHFPPAINIINVGSMVGSTIQQAANRSQQHASIGETEAKSLLELVSHLRSEIDRLNLSADDRREVDAQLETVMAQARSDRPKRVIVREALETIRNVVEGVAGNAAAMALFSNFPQLAALLS